MAGTRTLYWRSYYHRNKERCRGWTEKYRNNNREHFRALQRGYEKKHRAKRRVTQRLYRLKNAARVKSVLRQWRVKNIAKIREYDRRRRLTNPNAALKHRLSARVLKVLKRNHTHKNNRTVDLIGTSLDGLRQHLESLFKPGMSWVNRHLWHIDHIVPCAAFNLTDPREQMACFYYKNLQPLWAKENLTKQARV